MLHHEKCWTLFFVGSKNIKVSGTGIILISPSGDKLRYVLQLNFSSCTNDVAEYEALLHDMRITKKMGVNRLRCFGVSDLVAGQSMGTCDAVNPKMIAYQQAIERLASHSQDTASSGSIGARTRRPTSYLESARHGNLLHPVSSSISSTSHPSRYP